MAALPTWTYVSRSVPGLTTKRDEVYEAGSVPSHSSETQFMNQMKKQIDLSVTAPTEDPQPIDTRTHTHSTLGSELLVLAQAPMELPDPKQAEQALASALPPQSRLAPSLSRLWSSRRGLVSHFKPGPILNVATPLWGTSGDFANILNRKPLDTLIWLVLGSPPIISSSDSPPSVAKSCLPAPHPRRKGLCQTLAPSCPWLSSFCSDPTTLYLGYELW